MEIVADRVNNRLSVFLQKDRQEDVLAQKNVLNLLSFDSPCENSFTIEKTSELLKVDYSFEREKLFCSNAGSLTEEEIYDSLSAFIGFVFREQTENKLTDYSAILVDGKNFKLIDSLVLLNPEKTEIIKGFVLGLSEENPAFDQALKTELIGSFENNPGEEELFQIIEQHRYPQKYFIKVCPGCGKEYDFESNFCSNCGSKLEAKVLKNTELSEAQTEHFEEEKTVVSEFGISSEEPIPDYLEEPAQPVNQLPEYTEPAKEPSFEETTLLGFTNFGETSVLGGQATSFATPNIVRASTNEKIFITKRSFIIGKSVEAADYVINNSAISRVHAEITAIGNEYYIKDKNSTNHTYVNNQILLPEESKQIFEGDEIKLADESLVFHLY